MPPALFTDTPLKTRLLAACLLLAGRPGEGEELIASQSTPPGGGDFLKLYQAVIQARGKSLDEALAGLLALLDAAPQDQALREAVVVLLHRQGVQKIDAGDWPGAVAVLEHLQGLDPDYPGLADLKKPLEKFLPALALKANRREEAARVWEEQQRRNPNHGGTGHNLALLYYFESLDLAGSSSRPDYPHLQERWRRALANWVLTCFQDDFWEEWVAQRRRVYKVSPAALAKLRLNWSAELGKKFRQLKNELEDTGSEAGREFYEDLEAEYWLEMAAAATLQELKKFACPHCARPTLPERNAEGEAACGHPQCARPLPEAALSHHLPACGPLMLRQLDILNAARDLAQGAASLPAGGQLGPYLEALGLPFFQDNAGALDYLLAPWGLGVAHLAQRNFLKAIDHLKNAGRDDRVARLLLAAYLDYGQQSESFIPPLPPQPDEEAIRRYLVPVREALDIWRQGWQYHQADQELAAKMGERIEGLSVRAGNEMQQAAAPLAGKQEWKKEIRYLSAGIEALELGLKITPRERIKDTLAVLYLERGMSHLQNKSVNRCIDDLDKALRLRPGDAHLQQQAAVAYNHRGCQRKGSAARDDFTRAIKLDGTKGLYFRNRATSYSDIKDIFKAIEDMQQACRLEPGNAQYRQELEELMQIIRKLR